MHGPAGALIKLQRALDGLLPVVYRLRRATRRRCSNETPERCERRLRTPGVKMSRNSPIRRPATRWRKLGENIGTLCGGRRRAGMGRGSGVSQKWT